MEYLFFYGVVSPPSRSSVMDVDILRGKLFVVVKVRDEIRSKIFFFFDLVFALTEVM